MAMGLKRLGPAKANAQAFAIQPHAAVRTIMLGMKDDRMYPVSAKLAHRHTLIVIKRGEDFTVAAI